MGSVAVPLDFFVFQELLEDVVSKCFAHELAGLGSGDSLGKVTGQGIDASFISLLGGHLQFFGFFPHAPEYNTPARYCKDITVTLH